MTMLFCIAESEIKVIHTYIHLVELHLLSPSDDPRAQSNSLHTHARTHAHMHALTHARTYHTHTHARTHARITHTHAGALPVTLCGLFLTATSMLQRCRPYAHSTIIYFASLASFSRSCTVASWVVRSRCMLDNSVYSTVL